MKKIVLLSMIIALCASCGQKSKYSYDPNKIKSDTTKEERLSESFEIDFKSYQNNLKTIHVKLNDTNGYDAIFDTGCSSISISMQEFEALCKAGTIYKSDIKAPITVTTADGTQRNIPVVNIREITVVDKTGKAHTLTNIDASVEENIAAPILVGGEFIDNITKTSYEIDLSNNVIRFK